MASDNPFSGLREKMLNLYYQAEKDLFREPVFRNQFQDAKLDDVIISRAGVKFLWGKISEDQRAHLQGLFLAYLEDLASSIYKEYYDKKFGSGPNIAINSLLDQFESKKVTSLENIRTVLDKCVTENKEEDYWFTNAVRGILLTNAFAISESSSESYQSELEQRISKLIPPPSNTNEEKQQQIYSP
ncbi:TPA: hypothetical protein JAN90_16565 [Legionella pneumophila]|uniref:hypothetical protein n=1 Tax=Legionella TaxID=445 RepID=UPI0007781A64|nr:MULTISPECIES: hypothetical protein [Legionella]HAT8857332.1 hypothetical protein [Legionella pneumophila subsp. pneumophila]MCW8394864.1 hypothetical protein [Legionella sp. PATHC039]HAT7071775.1 hypothetical protein [Legionella pneumophila]HAT7074326.1 hypothetical protein [Legionella pneumophila]HAT8640194.1 hypothetical protein [Legionella pneumophila]